MEVVNVAGFPVCGPSEKLWDRAECEANENGAVVLGVVAGHGEKGHLITNVAINAVRVVARTRYEGGVDAWQMAHSIGENFVKLSERLGSTNNIDRFAKTGVDATAGVILGNRVELAHMGRTQALWLASDGSIIPLTKAHDRANPKEAHDVREAGGVLQYFNDENLMGWYWGDPKTGFEYVTSTSRAIGDLALRFVNRIPEFITFDVFEAGQLVIGTPGFMGAELDLDVEQHIREGTLDETVFKQITEDRGGSAAVVVATVA